MSIRREKRRLDRAFQAVLLALGSPAIVVACSSSGGREGADAGAKGLPDATIAGDGSEAGGQAYDAAADRAEIDAGDAARADAAANGGSSGGGAVGPPDATVADAGPNGCYLSAVELDASYEDADLCAYGYACGGFGGLGLVPVGCTVLQVVPAAEAGVGPIPGMACWLEQGHGCDQDAFAPDGEGGTFTILCSPCPPGGGRRPAGLLNECRTSGENALEGYFARMAFEEGAAIVAFERMEVELTAFGAPASLRTGARRAAADEVRHARTMARLARRGGASAKVPRVRVKGGGVRSAPAVAAENAAEGCIRETYGALLTLWQSQHAGDAGARRAFATIAREEARHAALSWALARWIEPKLDAVGEKRVARARRRASRALERAIAIEPPAELVEKAGLPTATEARRLLDGMRRELGIER